jgi:tetratricopeptide (TPR) repeat protein
MQASDDYHECLGRRARRLARKGELRKAAVALRERANLRNDAASWAALGDMLRRARRTGEALRALRQALWLHRSKGALLRARTVARMIVALDPRDLPALALIETASRRGAHGVHA